MNGNLYQCYGTLRHMIKLVNVQAYECSVCGWLWFNKQGCGLPKRCPRRSCRKLAGYIQMEAKDYKEFVKPKAAEPKPKVWLKTSDALRAMRER